jgi:hypothetical protein
MTYGLEYQLEPFDTFIPLLAKLLASIAGVAVVTFTE